MLKRINIIAGYDSKLELMDLIAESIKSINNTSTCAVSITNTHSDIHDYKLIYNRNKASLLIKQIEELDTGHIFIYDSDFMQLKDILKMIKLSKTFYIVDVFNATTIYNTINKKEDNVTLIEVIDGGVLLNNELIGINTYKSIMMRNLVIDNIIQ